MKLRHLICYGSLMIASGSLLFPISAIAASGLNIQDSPQSLSESTELSVPSEVLLSQSFSDITSRIQETYGRIRDYALELARAYSPGSLSWQEAEVDFLESQGLLRVTLRGRAPAIIGSRSVRLVLAFQADNSLNFHYTGDFDLHVSRCGRGRPVCRRKRGRARGRIEDALNSNRTQIEAAINAEVRRLIPGI